MLRKLVSINFSSSDLSDEVIKSIAGDVAKQVGELLPENLEAENIYAEALEEKSEVSFDDETLVIIGVEARRSRVPMEYIKKMQYINGNGAIAIVVVTYSTQSYGRSLYELYTFAEDQGFKVVSAAAFVADYLDYPVIKNQLQPRPDVKDYDLINAFSCLTTHKLQRVCGTDVGFLKCKIMPLQIETKRLGLPKSIAILSARRREPEWFL